MQMVDQNVASWSVAITRKVEKLPCAADLLPGVDIFQLVPESEIAGQEDIVFFATVALVVGAFIN